MNIFHFEADQIPTDSKDSTSHSLPGRERGINQKVENYQKFINTIVVRRQSSFLGQHALLYFEYFRSHFHTTSTATTAGDSHRLAIIDESLLAWFYLFTCQSLCSLLAQQHPTISPLLCSSLSFLWSMPYLRLRSSISTMSSLSRQHRHHGIAHPVTITSVTGWIDENRRKSVRIVWSSLFFMCWKSISSMCEHNVSMSDEHILRWIDLSEPETHRCSMWKQQRMSQ